MFQQFLKNGKTIYLNDRHEEVSHGEPRCRIYDQKILSLLDRNDFAIFGERINPFLWNYYRSLGLAEINPKNIFYADSYLEYPSITKSVLADESLCKELKQNNIDFLIPYFESIDTETLAKKINAKLLRSAKFTEWINNKTNFRKILKELKIPMIPGYQTNLKKAKNHYKILKKSGFQKVVLKIERSVSGIGVFIVEKEKELHECLEKYFNQEEKFVLEGFIENVQHSPNFQYFISKKNIEFITTTDQLIGKDGLFYSGNLYPSFSVNEPDVFDAINNKSRKICKRLQDRQCFGLVGIDYIVTKQRKVYPVEANVRLNDSTSPHLIIKKLFNKQKENISWIFETYYFEKPISFKDLFQKFNYFIKKKGKYGVFPLCVDLMEEMNEGQFIIISKNLKGVKDLKKEFLKFASNKDITEVFRSIR